MYICMSCSYAVHVMHFCCTLLERERPPSICTTYTAITEAWSSSVGQCSVRLKVASAPCPAWDRSSVHRQVRADWESRTQPRFRHCGECPGYAAPKRQGGNWKPQNAKLEPGQNSVAVFFHAFFCLFAFVSTHLFFVKACKMADNTPNPLKPESKVCLIFSTPVSVCRVSYLPSRELTYPPKMAFWRWFSFSQGGIC